MPDPSQEEYNRSAQELDDLRSRRAWVAGLERTVMTLADQSSRDAILSQEGQSGIDSRKETLTSALTWMNLGTTEQSDLAKSIAELTGGNTGGAITVSGVFTAQKKYLDSQIETVADQLFTIAPNLASVQYPSYATEKRAGLSGSAAPKVAQVLQGSDGTVFTVSTDGSIVRKGTFPELQTGFEAHTDRQGRLVAFNPNRPDLPPTVLDPNFGFAEVDPQIKFKVETAAAFAGLDLQRRGQTIAAWGTDAANRIQVGRLELDEAQLELNRIDTAFNQRRADEALKLQYAVAGSSVFMGPNGERLTRPPLSGPLAKAMGISPDELNLPVTSVNPDQTARDVLAASQFESPVAALKAQLDATRDAIGGLTAAPAAGEALLKGVLNGG